jgi:hypothetical protein
MTEISESAKAIQELAKVANTGIDFVARILGEPLEVALGMVTLWLNTIQGTAT